MSNRKNNKKPKPEKLQAKAKEHEKKLDAIEETAEEVFESSDAESVEAVVVPKSSERPSGAATIESWGMSGTGSIVEVEPAKNTVAQQWRLVKGSEVGEANFRFASIANYEDRNDQIPLENGIMYVIEWRMEAGDSFPTASVPGVIADYLRNCNDAARKYAEL